MRNLTGSEYNKFLHDFSKIASSDDDTLGDLLKIADSFGIDILSFENGVGEPPIIKDGVIYEENQDGINIIYGTDKAINDMISNLYSTSLYYKHLEIENRKKANNSSLLGSKLFDFANSHSINVSVPYNLENFKKKYTRKKIDTFKLLHFKQSS